MLGCEIDLEKPLDTLQIASEVDGTKGYSTDLKLTTSELHLLREIISIQWLYRLQLLVPEHIKKFHENGIERYHELSHLIDHAKAWPKYSRVLPKQAVDLVRKMDFIKQLEKQFGSFKIADEENLGWENVYWRLARPGAIDYGTIHSDRWFVELGYYGDEVQNPAYERIKIWIPLYTKVGKNGLLVIPGSHTKKDWKWHAEELYGLQKPVIDEDVTALNPYLLPLEPGNAIVFNYDLLHGGAPNLAETTRVSLEFTLLKS